MDVIGSSPITGTMEQSDRYFARANIQFLPPGQWVEINAQKFASLQKYAKDKRGNFHKAGVQAVTITPTFPAKVFEHIEPELFEILSQEKDT